MTDPASDYLPLTETLAPGDTDELVDIVRRSHDEAVPVYPSGGGTGLGFGVVPQRPGRGVSLAKLNRVVDYPFRDMTVTVEAGVTMAELQKTLAKKGQRLPVDVPRADVATIGGVVATGAGGPRRYHWRTIRGYVIGVSAVDGRGVPFQGGGRVVKNAAGYDFCKLLTGSLGTLGIITQLTLKVVPRPETSALVVCGLPEVGRAERLLAGLVDTRTIPVAIELLAGPHWRQASRLELSAETSAVLVVGFEASAAEVEWMTDRLAREWRELGASVAEVFAGGAADGFWDDLAQFPASGDAPLVLKACVPPGRTVEFVKDVLKVDPDCSIAAHAGNGVVIARFADGFAADLSEVLTGRLHPAARQAGGHAVVLSVRDAAGLSRAAVWGPENGSLEIMRAIKRQFDPKDILNPGRFVY